MALWIKRVLGVLLLIFALLTGILFVFFNEDVPDGHSPQKADEIANKMLKSLNNEAYQDSRYLEWSYRGGRNNYIWDKEMGKVEMSWGDYTGEIDLVNPSNSSVKEGEEQILGEEKEKLVKEAISNFNNDSFWLVAPFKIFDKGTKRAVVDLDDEKIGLKVTYTLGGDTPGDTYVWELNEKYLPERFRMWVQILPLKGLGATWEGWDLTESGALLPQYHKVGPLKLDLGTVRARKD
ncbi:hypothetical protein [Muriicola soli]|uniref:Uncharacterized protein n=1 Tax=Muriicola soli TaxID=2507538 RepID=A0A411E8P9_9FLAO|nr:hypothetical protein [Muriicola soli]QBA64105.1 hypothetical protein EQY75_05900 [Muriicola soli]